MLAGLPVGGDAEAVEQPLDHALGVVEVRGSAIGRGQPGCLAALSGQHCGYDFNLFGQVAAAGEEDAPGLEQPKGAGAVGLVGGEVGQQPGVERGAQVFVGGAHGVGETHGRGCFLDRDGPLYQVHGGNGVS